MEARSNEYSSANSYFICASAVLHQHLCVLQPEKGFRELPFYKEKIMRLSRQLVSRVWRSVVLRRFGIAENAFTVGCRQAGMIHGRSARLFSSMLAVRYLRRSQYTTISGLVRDLYGTKTSFIMVIAMYHPVRHHRPAVQGGRLDSGIASAGYFHGSERYVLLFPDLHAGSSESAVWEVFL